MTVTSIFDPPSRRIYSETPSAAPSASSFSLSRQSLSALPYSYTVPGYEATAGSRRDDKVHSLSTIGIDMCTRGAESKSLLSRPEFHRRTPMAHEATMAR
jgi:hypothetical protein